MILTKAAGVVAGGGLAAWWSLILAADVAGHVERATMAAGNLTQAARPPTLAEVAAAQGTITWLLFIAA